MSADFLAKDFQLLTRVGSGAFADVDAMRHTPTGKIYAVKKIDRSKLQVLDRTADAFTDRDIMYKLLNRGDQADPTQNVAVRLFGTFSTPTHYCFVMRMHNFDLGKFLEANPGGLPYSLLVQWAAELVHCIGYLHKRRIWHRDLKPENVLITDDGHLVLTDFGLSKYFEDNQQQHHTNTTVGTRPFIAPEVHMRWDYNEAVDWWSFGVILHRLVFGRLPFSDKGLSAEAFQRLVCNGPKLTPESFRWAGVDAPNDSVGDLICQLLQRNPSLRLSDEVAIRRHPFFQKVDWRQIEQKSSPPHGWKVPAPSPHVA